MISQASPADTVEKVVDAFSTWPMLRSGILLVAFIFAVMNRKVWFGVDMLATAIFGFLWTFLPQLLLSFQINRAPDNVDNELARMLGIVMLGNAVLWFLATKRTRDPDTVHPALALTRVVSLGVLLIAMIDIQLFSKAWSFEHVTFGMLGCGVWLLGNLVHLVRGGYHGGHLQRDRSINNFLLFDFAVSTFVAFTLYGFPRWFLRNFTLIRTLDGVHEHLTRTFGAVLFGTGLYGFQAVGFLNDSDKEAHFIQRIIINVGLALSVLYSQYIHYKEWNMITCWAIQFALTLWTIHAYLGRQAASFMGRAIYSARKPAASRRIIERRTEYASAGDYDRED